MLEKVRDEKREKSKEEEPQALAAQPIQRTEIEKCYFIGTLEAAEGQAQRSDIYLQFIFLFNRKMKKIIKL